MNGVYIQYTNRSFLSVRAAGQLLALLLSGRGFSGNDDLG